MLLSASFYSINNPMEHFDLRLSQLDRVLIDAPLPAVPPSGWLKPIRTALGITTRQLGRKLGITSPSVVAAEASEAEGTITLTQLRRFANALGCDMRYVLIPRGSLRQRVEQRAEVLARQRVGRVAHTMTLEAQGTDPQFVERQIASLKADLLKKRRSVLWND